MKEDEEKKYDLYDMMEVEFKDEMYVKAISEPSVFPEQILAQSTSNSQDLKSVPSSSSSTTSTAQTSHKPNSKRQDKRKATTVIGDDDIPIISEPIYDSSLEYQPPVTEAAPKKKKKTAADTTVEKKTKKTKKATAASSSSAVVVEEASADKKRRKGKRKASEISQEQEPAVRKTKKLRTKLPEQKEELLWTPQEDELLLKAVESYGTTNWRVIHDIFDQTSFVHTFGKSEIACRNRYYYLKPEHMPPTQPPPPAKTDQLGDIENALNTPQMTPAEIAAATALKMPTPTIHTQNPEQVAQELNQAQLKVIKSSLEKIQTNWTEIKPMQTITKRSKKKAPTIREPAPTKIIKPKLSAMESLAAGTPFRKPVEHFANLMKVLDRANFLTLFPPRFNTAGGGSGSDPQSAASSSTASSSSAPVREEPAAREETKRTKKRGDKKTEKKSEKKSGEKKSRTKETSAAVPPILTSAVAATSLVNTSPQTPTPGIASASNYGMLEQVRNTTPTMAPQQYAFPTGVLSYAQQVMQPTIQQQQLAQALLQQQQALQAQMARADFRETIAQHVKDFVPHRAGDVEQILQANIPDSEKQERINALLKPYP